MVSIPLQLPLRSIALKLTLAFLVVGLTGALLVAFFVGQRARREFDQFLLNRSQVNLVERLADYYASHGSWDGLPEQLWRRDLPVPRPNGLVLADAHGRVVWGGRPGNPGTILAARELAGGVPIRVNDQVVGWLLIDWPRSRQLPGSPEQDFLSRINRAIVLGALGATAVALLLGVILARTLTRPIRELTAATQQVAQGDLGHQVEIHTQDELGELASSFNQMSARLARANQLRRQMTADIAHDLRTPLSVILGYTEALSEAKLPGSPEIYEVMHAEAQHLSRLIDDLRTLSLADAGELPLFREETEPGALLSRVAMAQRPQAEQRGVTLTVRQEASLPTIQVDPERMVQVLGNLVGNALRYTPAGGTIELAAYPTAGGVVLQVRDTGSGIDPEDLPYIFERFYRGDKARHENGESGLGLAIAKSLVEAHGGTIQVESTPGEGTTFRITLPAEPPSGGG
ncbi:sensor histidine kinase [Litorilinea aerophila]|uniref:histidine kinase n=1 Tax=Litorilinea aerophila TaxID=1204385 RepID=A0A540V926_9CHLR|nr:HAMP domain-containing sensor histidine kinase [Litorilinea aerophila]